jgi:hypothetical protein
MPVSKSVHSILKEIAAVAHLSEEQAFSLPTPEQIRAAYSACANELSKNASHKTSRQLVEIFKEQMELINLDHENGEINYKAELKQIIEYRRGESVVFPIDDFEGTLIADFDYANVYKHLPESARAPLPKLAAG